MPRIALVSLLTVGIIACQDVTPPVDLSPVLDVTASGNPFVGSWENTDVFDGSHQHMTVGNGPNLPVQLRDDAGSVCIAAGFGFVPATIKGFAVMTGDDPFTFELTGDVFCHPKGPGGPQLVLEDITLPFTYNPESDTLFIGAGGDCWYRSGNPESCA